MMLGALTRESRIKVADFLEGEQGIFVDVFYVDVDRVSTYALI
jgi:hypothetical protein